MYVCKIETAGCASLPPLNWGEYSISQAGMEDSPLLQGFPSELDLSITTRVSISCTSGPLFTPRLPSCHLLTNQYDVNMQMLAVYD